LADANNALYIEISSKTSINLDKLISEPLVQLLDLYEKNVFPASDANGLKDMKIESNKYLSMNKEKKCCIIQ